MLIAVNSTNPAVSDGLAHRGSLPGRRREVYPVPNGRQRGLWSAVAFLEPGLSFPSATYSLSDLALPSPHLSNGNNNSCLPGLLEGQGKPETPRRAAFLKGAAL